MMKYRRHICTGVLKYWGIGKPGLHRSNTPIFYVFLLYLLLWFPLIGYAENPLTPLPAGNSWQVLEAGLEFGIFRTPNSPENSGISVLRIDPAYFEFRLLNASATSTKQLLTAKEWCRQYNLVAAINASMYQEDYLASVSLMQTAGHINNPRLSKDKSILAFDRRTLDVPSLKIIDRQCENFEEWKPRYTTFIQSIRMISCYGKNVWRQQPQKWSTAAIAIDKLRRVQSEPQDQQCQVFGAILKQYLGDRFDKTSGSMTAADCCHLVKAQTRNQELAHQMRDLVDACEAAHYSAASLHIDAQQVDSAIDLIKEIHRLTKK